MVLISAILIKNTTDTNLKNIRLNQITVIGSISRFVDWKGVDYTVKAFIEYYKIYLTQFNIS